MKEKTNKISVHEGHRERLSEFIANVGFDKVSKIQQVEFMLFLIRPRIDVNPIAHRLLDRFGNLASILDADVNELVQVEGISIHSANKIKGLRGIFDVYLQEKTAKKVSLKNNKEFLDFIESKLRFKSTENLLLLAISNNFSVTGFRMYDMKQVRKVGIPPAEICNFVFSTRPAHIAVVHNHVGGSANASDDDHKAVDLIKNLVSFFECDFLDSLIIGDEGIYSEEREGYLRDYENQEFMVD